MSYRHCMFCVWSLIPLLCVIEESEAGGEQDIMQVLGSMVMALLVKYWIYICGGMFFFVSFEGTIVMYKIIYMMMFLSCVALYQVSEAETVDKAGLLFDPLLSSC